MSEYNISLRYANALMKLADRHYVMEKGEVVWSGATDEIADNEELKARYLGVWWSAS